MNKRKIYLKLTLDLVLLVLLALMYQKRAINMQFHEWGGIALCGLFLIHKALNWKWIRAVTAGIFQRKVKLNTCWIVDVLLLLSMTAVLVTGLLISKTLPTAIAGAHGLQMWHYFFAAAALALSGLHLGLHGAHLKNNLWKKLPLPEKAGKYMGAALLCLLFLFGSCNLLTSGFHSLFYRPFVSMPLPQGGDHPAFEVMEHAQENGRGIGEGTGKGMGQGEGRPGGGIGNGPGGFGEGMGRGQGGPGYGMNPAQQDISIGNAISTFLTYASILCWFAIVTTFLSGWFRKQFRTKKSTSDV